jgi:hypothetical protein
MSRLKVGLSVCLPLVLLMAASTVRATTLSVSCAAKEGLHSIGAALKVLQNGAGHEPSTINVFGACHENVVIQSLDRLTLNAVNGASVSDASGGKLDVIAVYDSRDVAINGFAINAGSDGVSGANGISCNEWSACRLALNVIQGASSGAGFAVYSASEATVDGDTFQNNGVGLIVHSGTRVRPWGQTRSITVRSNGQGMHIARQAYVFVLATVENNSQQGVVMRFHSTLDLTGSISHNGDVGAVILESSAARFTSSTLTNNGGPGVLVGDLSMVTFGTDTVTGNGGGTDVVCSPQFSATRGALTDIGGGTTNCVEP